jgi:superfamily II DNA helicase RecQ
VDYREELDAARFAVFSRLRAERKKWADAEGVPVYTIFSNAQLAEMVKRGVRTTAELEAIEGVGPARVGKSGERLLLVLAELPVPPAKQSGGDP